MENIHFFTEGDLLASSQSSNDTYGMINADRFRTTSRIFGNSIAQTNNTKIKVFAPFSGRVFITDCLDASSNVLPDYVNLILFPHLPSTLNLSPQLKCIVYRGLLREDFMQEVPGSSPTEWQLLDSSQIASNGTEFMQYNDSKANLLDLDSLPYYPYHLDIENFLLNNLIIKGFSKTVGTNTYTGKPGSTFTKKGQVIGHFNAGNGLGIDVLLNEPTKFSPNLKYCCAGNYEIQVNTANPIPDPGQEDWDILAQRERVLSFMDPCTYLNLFREMGVNFVGTHGTTQPSILTNSSDALYDSVISKFYTKNRIYIDIRNDVDHSLNFYHDNQNDNDVSVASYDGNFQLKQGLFPNFLDSWSYTGMWPIVFFDNPPTHPYGYTFYDFKFYDHYHIDPMLYFDFATTEDYVDKKNSTNPARFRAMHDSESKFLQLGQDVSNKMTKPLSAFRKVVSPNTSHTSPIAETWYIKFYYLRRKVPENVDLSSNGIKSLPTRLIKRVYYMDSVFGPMDASNVAGLHYDFDSSLGMTYSYWRQGLEKKFLPRGENNPIDRMVQTGVGLSGADVTFFAIDIDKNARSTLLSPRGLGVSVDGSSQYPEFKTAWVNNLDRRLSKVYGGNNDLIGVSLNRDIHDVDDSETVFSINLTRIELCYIQYLIENSSPGYDTDEHKIYFTFDGITNEVDTSDTPHYYYGQAKLNLIGYSNGAISQINALAYPTSSVPADPANWVTPGGYLFLRMVEDSKTLMSIEAASQVDDNIVIKERSPLRGIIPIRKSYDTGYTGAYDYIELLKKVEEAFPIETEISEYNSASANQKIELEKTYVGIITGRLRRHSYGRFDKVRGDKPVSKANHTIWDLKPNPFDMALPNSLGADGLFKSKVAGGQHGTGNLAVSTFHMAVENDVYELLTSQADENSIADNPSPYIKDADGNLIDVGHLLYGLDGLIHNHASTARFYWKNFKILASNDLTGYIADVFTSAAEARLYSNGTSQRLRSEKFHYPSPMSWSYDRIYELSAPLADLMSDVDTFGLYYAYKRILDDPSSTKEQRTLSYIFEQYYDNQCAYNLAAQKGNYKKRWLLFCKSLDLTNSPITLPNGQSETTPIGKKPSGLPYKFYTEYQGFVDSNDNWTADSSPATSGMEALRRRGEVFASFWHQSKLASKEAIFGVSYLLGLDSQVFTAGTSARPVRFERDFSSNTNFETLDPNEAYAQSLGNHTDPTEIEYFMNKFLSWVKNNYDNE